MLSINLMVVVYAAIFGFALLVGLGVHFVQAYGLSRMAKACGLKRPWLAWIPVANSYTVGEIAKCNALKQRKKPMAYDKLLLGLRLATTVMGSAFVVVYLMIMGTLLSGMPDESYTAEFLMSPSLQGVDEQVLIASMLCFILVCLLTAAAGVIYTVFWYIALWQIYKLYDDKNAVLYILLSIFVSIAVPIIFVILGGRQPDLMPPVYEYGNNAYDHHDR